MKMQAIKNSRIMEAVGALTLVFICGLFSSPSTATYEWMLFTQKQSPETYPPCPGPYLYTHPPCPHLYLLCMSPTPISVHMYPMSTLIPVQSVMEFRFQIRIFFDPGWINYLGWYGLNLLHQLRHRERSISAVKSEVNHLKYRIL